MTTITPNEHAEKAKEYYNQGEYLKAAELFGICITAYKNQGDDLMAAEMANNQSVAYLQGEEAQKALDALEDTIEIFDSAGDKLKLAMSYGNRAAAWEALKSFEKAIQDYKTSAEMLNDLGEKEYYSQVMQSLSAVQLKTGHSMEAMATMQAGISAVKKPSFIQRTFKKLFNLTSKLQKS